MKIFRSETLVKPVSLVLIGAMMNIVMLGGCSSTTTINSEPQGAKAYVNGQYLGITPVSYSDTAIVGTARDVKLELEGYEEFRGVFTRSGEPNILAIIGGIFFLVPFLWTLDYEKQYTFELRPVE